MVAKRLAPFRAKYAVELGLRVQDRDPETNEVLSATCLFCELFGRENKPGAQRRPTEKVAIFKPPFRKDSIQIHHVGQHPSKWKEYCALSSDDSKRAFFIAAGASMELSESNVANIRPRKTQRTSNSTPISTPVAVRPVNSQQEVVVTGSAVHWLVNRDIITVLIGIMLPYAASPVPAGQTYQLHAVADFEDMINSSGVAVDMILARYRVVVKNPVQFQQFVDYLSTSGSLVNTSKMLYATCQPTVAGPFFDERQAPVNVAQYARFLCAVNFQKLTVVAKSSGIYSICLQVVPIAPASFFEAQVEYCLQLQLRVFVDGQVMNFHLLSIPLNKRRRSDADGSSGVFEIAETTLNAIVPRWKDVILAVVSDSDYITPVPDDPRLLLRNAVVSRFESVLGSGFLRVSCAARQLDAIMQKFFTKIVGSDEVYSQLTTLVSYVSRQRVLLNSMQTSAPTLSDSRWRSVASAVMWFQHHGASIREQFELQTTFAPPPSWWIRILVAARISHEVLPILEGISGWTTEASHPRDAVVKIRTFLLNWFIVSGSLGIDDPAVAAATARPRDNDSVVSKDGKCSIKTGDVFTALQDLGTFVADTLEIENDDNTSPSVGNTVKEIATGIVNLVSGLHSITIDIDGVGGLLSALPAVLPQDLVKMRGRQFAAVVRPQIQRLRLAGWSRQEIDWIEQEFQDLRGAYFREESLKIAIESYSNETSFHGSWGCVRGRFKHLQRFCGAMATAYPVDFTDPASNLSIFGNHLAPMSRVSSLPGDVEAGVSDLSVQAALQAKQFRRLQAIVI
ncbi:hypothetical protein P3T76_013694 [Phytophthora citrophthora]|uniref:Uncharacterized protein n=1 Tax=Phytophthora citrophthora TaxID=4793 RepID=A0AAD9G2F3_9STRA|nr:hypothetical protein P3T76_013694 [Phytophthora citrophthora]